MSTYSIDYTSRDYDALRADLITLIQNNMTSQGKSWEANDPSDFGVALVEAFAYVGDITNYYIDRIANEAYLPTAIQRSSVLKLAKTLNYSPHGFLRASVELVVTNSVNEAITIPEGTQFSVTVAGSGGSSKKVLFHADSDQVVEASEDGTSTITVFHGEQVALRAANRDSSENGLDGEYLTTSSSGAAGQSYRLKVANPVDSTIEVFIDENGTYVPWTRVPHLYDYGPNSTIFEAVVNSDNTVDIKFGDGVNGAAPALGSEIKAVYVSVKEGGAAGNIPDGLTNWRVTAVPSDSEVSATYLDTKLSFTNPDPGLGGSDPENNDSIRLNAPAALTALTRAVTLSDFAKLALSVPGIGQNKAAAYAEVPTSVLLYVGPQDTTYAKSFYPGMNNDGTISADMFELMDDVEQYVGSRAQIGTTLTVLSPEYKDVNIMVRYQSVNGVKDSAVESSLLTALNNGFGYDATTFNETLYPEAIENFLMKYSTSDLVRVVELWKEEDGTAARDVILPEQGVLYIFSDAERDAITKRKGITFYPWASLKSLTSNVGTWDHTFTPTRLKYSIKTTASSITLSYVKIEDTDTVAYYVGKKLDADGIITGLVVGKTKTVNVVVTSSDGLSTRTYTLRVTRKAS